MKDTLKTKAIELRKQGMSYSEILEYIPVAKSTLSLWLRSVGLAIKQEQRITEKRIQGSLRGAAIRKKDRIDRSIKIKEIAFKEIGHLSKREIWLLGVALYWAEGTKEKDYRPGSGVQFINSDPRMIQFFLFWLKDSCQIPSEAIRFEIYIHKDSEYKIPEAVKYWSKITNFPKDCFNKIYFKKGNNKKTSRANIGEAYFGILKIKLKESSTLVRKIDGWTNGITATIAK